MIWELSQVGPASSATDAKRRLAAAVKLTASRLGNRPATCRGYYVHPEIIDSYVNRRLFGSCQNLKSPQDCEKALLALVQRVHRPRFARTDIAA
jgi:DNA topoisomerase-1